MQCSKLKLMKIKYRCSEYLSIHSTPLFKLKNEFEIKSVQASWSNQTLFYIFTYFLPFSQCLLFLQTYRHLTRFITCSSKACIPLRLCTFIHNSHLRLSAFCVKMVMNILHFMRLMVDFQTFNTNYKKTYMTLFYIYRFVFAPCYVVVMFFCTLQNVVP